MLQQPAYVQAAQRSLEFLATLQILDSPDDGIRGGIAGAYPIWGDYGRFEYLNWAAKFFAEALMLRSGCAHEIATDGPAPAAATTAEPPMAALT